MIIHMSICLYSCETDMSEGYLNVCDLLYFITIYNNRGNLHDAWGLLGGRGYLSSHMLDILQITMSLL